MPAQEQGSAREEERERGQQALAYRVLLVDLELCSDVAYAEFGAGACDFAAESGR